MIAQTKLYIQIDRAVHDRVTDVYAVDQSVRENLSLLDLPSNTLEFHFFERLETVVQGETLRGEPKNHSPKYMPGLRLSIEDAIDRTAPGEDRLWLIKRKADGETEILQGTWGHTPLVEGDSFLPYQVNYLDILVRQQPAPTPRTTPRLEAKKAA